MNSGDEGSIFRVDDIAGCIDRSQCSDLQIASLEGGTADPACRHAS